MAQHDGNAIEPLERREMLSAVAVLVDRVLEVTGTDAAEAIDLTQYNGVIDVTAVGSFPAADISLISISAGAGNDTISVDGEVTLPVYANGNQGDDSIRRESLYTTVDAPPPPTTLAGGQGNDYIDGGASMSLRGGAGQDTLRDLSLDGSDTLDGGPGSDSLSGLYGFTVSYAGRTNPVHVTVGPEHTTGNGEPGENDTLAEARGAIGGSGNDTLTALGGVEQLIGGPGDDSLTGVSADTLRGGPGNDTLISGASGGNNLLVAGRGNNVIQGSTGDDTILAQNGESDTIDGGGGTDSAKIDPALDLITNVANLI